MTSSLPYVYIYTDIIHIPYIDSYESGTPHVQLYNFTHIGLILMILCAADAPHQDLSRHT